MCEEVQTLVVKSRTKNNKKTTTVMLSLSQYLVVVEKKLLFLFPWAIYFVNTIFLLTDWLFSSVTRTMYKPVFILEVETESFPLASKEV